MTPETAHLSITQQPDDRRWNVTQNDDGEFIAVRTDETTTYQRHYGVIDEIACASVSELHLLVDAQDRLAQRVSLAEAVHEAGLRTRMSALGFERRGGSPES